MQSGVQISILNIDSFRERLRKMTDEQLREFGEAARYVTAPKANLGKPPLEVYVLQLEEATAEWRRRHPKNWQSESVNEQ
jgi:hypothetical protein